jgi:hypothetical protein
MLPWHLGSIACHTAVSSGDYDARTEGPSEAEANRFAAELLIPTEWLEDLIASTGTERVTPLLEALRIARVSAYVANLRLTAALPAGYVFALVDEHGAVEMSGRSAGTIAPAPREGVAMNVAAFSRFASAYEATEFRGRQVLWWSFRGAAEPGDVRADSRTAALVLQDLATAHSSGSRDAQRLANRLNGITAYAYDHARRQGDLPEDQLLAWLRSRFAGRSDLPAQLMHDPDLDQYLRKRSRELAEKARPRR